MKVKKTPLIVAALSTAAAIALFSMPKFMATAEATTCTGTGYGTGFCNPNYPGYPTPTYGWINSNIDGMQGSSTIDITSGALGVPPSGKFDMVKNIVRIHDFINNYINQGWTMAYGQLYTGSANNGYGAIADSDLSSYAYVLHGNPLYMALQIQAVGAQGQAWVKGYQASTSIPIDTTSIVVNKAGGIFAPWDGNGLSMTHTQPDPYPPNDPTTPDPNAVYSVVDWYTAPFPSDMSVGTNKKTYSKALHTGISTHQRYEISSMVTDYPRNRFLVIRKYL